MQGMHDSTRKAPRMAQKSATGAKVATAAGAAATQGAAAKGKSSGVWRTFDHAAPAQQIAPQSEAPESAAHHGAQQQESASFYEGLLRDEPATEGAECRAAVLRRAGLHVVESADDTAARVDAMLADAVRIQTDTDSEEWTENPQLPGAHEHNPVPLHSLEPTFAEWIEAEAAAMGADVSGIWAAATVGALSLLTGRVELRDGALRLPMNAGGCIIGLPGRKKTAAFHAGLQFLESYRREAYAAWNQEHEAWSAAGEKGKAPRIGRRYMGGDATPEGLRDMLATDSGGLIAIDEAAGLMEKMNDGRSAGARQQFMSYLSGEGGDDADVRRHSTNPLALSPALSFMGTLQPSVLRAIATNKGKDGFAARFWLSAWLPVDVRQPDRKAAEWAQEMREKVRPIYDALRALRPNLDALGNPTPKAIRFADGEAFARWRAALEAPFAAVCDESPMCSHGLKTACNTAKVLAFDAIARAVIAGEDIGQALPLVQMQGAHELAHYFLTFARRMYGEAEAGDLTDARRVAGLLRAGKLAPRGGLITTNEARRAAWGGSGTKARAEAALLMLEAYDIVRGERDGKGKLAKVLRWRVNPHALPR